MQSANKASKFNRETLNVRVRCNELFLFIFRRPAVVLGIETSCDDTGCAIVDGNGRILGENKYSQLQFHLRLVSQ